MLITIGGCGWRRYFFWATSRHGPGSIEGGMAVKARIKVSFVWGGGLYAISGFRRANKS